MIEKNESKDNDMKRMRNKVSNTNYVMKSKDWSHKTDKNVNMKNHIPNYT